MFDRREAILSRLETILGTVPGILGAYRDRGDFQPTDVETGIDILPAAVLLDGKESVGLAGKYDPNTMQCGPSLMALEPQIFIIMKPAADINNTGIGQAMSLMRSQLINLVLQDIELKVLLGQNGALSYKGMMTDMQTGSTIQGQMQLEFVLVYVLDPRELQG
jgi:hypothetical protein